MDENVNPVEKKNIWTYLRDKRFLVLLLVIFVLLLIVVWQSCRKDESQQADRDTTELPVSDEMVFEFQLSSEDRHELEVTEGDIITVVFRLYRTDQDADFKMYALQNEIQFDGSVFELVEGSIDSAYTTSFHEMEDGFCRLFINTFSPTPEGTDFAQGAVLGTFQLKVLSGAGEHEVSSENYEMSMKNGEELYEATANNLKITIK